MNTIKNIIYNLRTRENQEFDMFNNNLDMQWTLSFEFIDNNIFMTCNYSTLTGLWFKSIDEVEYYLKNTFISDSRYDLY